eukprot:TRINITY_DN35787_c0_g1_i1.p1 TRINITY_DN35787_c0_g1~~TRINITY_DN35787_c0_g1_i1.p1  ORF type:complete len:277 (-),score=59.05 TRINITY_DN35787_c0_g1_i1:167-997(-)
MIWRVTVPLLALVAVVGAQGPQSLDFGCTQGVHAAAWGSVKRRFRTLFAENDPVRPFVLLPRDVVTSTLEGAIQDVNAVGGFKAEATGECGLGRIMIQLLNTMVLDDPAAVVRILREAEMLSSPIMTVLLDVPWVETAVSGWPLFGLLGQLSLHKVKVLSATVDQNAVDGLVDDATMTYFQMLATAQPSGNVGDMVVASAGFMTQPSLESPFALLTAMAAQAAAQVEVQQRVEMMLGLQDQIRTVLKSASELEASLSTRWPLWGLLHVCVDALTPP